MKKTINRLPDSELDIMLVLWKYEPPMTRIEIERVVNEKKALAPTTILSLLTRLEKKNFVKVTKQGKMNQDDIKELHDFLEELEDKEEDL